MRGWKYLVLLVGVVGATAVFAPMLEVKRGRVPLELSARQLSFGLERPYQWVERDLPAGAERYLPARLRSARSDARDVAEVTRYAAAAYVPSAMLALWGLVGVLRRRFGRVLAGLTVLTALVQAGAWVALYIGLGIARRESGIPGLELGLQFGMHVLLVVAGLALVAGLGGLARPDRGPRRAPSAAAPYPPPPGPPPGPARA
jgi:hypothetical protein